MEGKGMVEKPSRAGNGSLNMSRKEKFLLYLREQLHNKEFEATEWDELLDLISGLAPYYCNENCPIRQNSIDGVCDVQECGDFVLEFLKNSKIKLVKKDLEASL